MKHGVRGGWVPPEGGSKPPLPTTGSGVSAPPPSLSEAEIFRLIRENVYSHHYENCDGHNSYVDEESIKDAAKAVWLKLAKGE